MFSTITTRLTLSYLAILGAVIVVIAVVVYTQYASEERANLDTELRNYGEFLKTQAQITPGDISEVFDQLQDSIAEKTRPGFRTLKFFLTQGDSVVYDSANHLPVDTFLDSLQANKVKWARDSAFQTVTFSDARYRLFVRSIPGQEKLDYRIIVVASLDPLEEQFAWFRNLLLIIVPASLIVASAGGYYLSRRALAPVASLTATAAAISSSNLHQRVPVGKSGDELAQLAITFNQMIDRLENMFEGQRRFVADASHDLRTPLSIIQAELELLLPRHSEDAYTTAALQRTIGEVGRLSELAADLLLLARADAHQLSVVPENVRLDEMLVDSISGLRTLASQRGVSIKVDIGEPIEVACEPMTLQRAFTNVIENAIKFSLEHSTITVQLRRYGSNAEVRVIDRGTGIPASELPRLFDRFYRSDRARNAQGTGLGLAIAKAVVEMHNGTIAIESVQGTGTTAIISLPAIPEEELYEALA